jgi:hypothetical protein
MPKVKFEDGIVINFESMPSQQDIEEAYNQAKGTTSPIQSQVSTSPITSLRNFINTAPQRTEEKIATRPSALADLIQDPTTLKRFMKHPIGTSLRTLGGAWELAEGVPADILTSLEEPKKIPQRILETFMGKRPAQFGDFLRKAGAPEPVAAVGGLLATGIEGTPTAGLGKVTAKILSPATKALGYVMGKVGKPALAQAMRFFTGTIPPKYAERVLEKSEILSPKLLAQEGREASKLYQTVIQPLRNDPKAIINLQPVQERILQEGLVTPYGEPSPEMSKLSKIEFTKIKGWTDKLNLLVKGEVKTTFNRVEGWINEIDASLGKFYKGKEKALLTGRQPISEPFNRLASILRSSLDNARKTQYPEVAPIIERYSQYLFDKQAADSFKGINASFFKALPIKMAILSMGASTRGAALPAYLATMPAFWKKIIQSGGTTQKMISEHPEYLIPILRKYLQEGNEEE